MQIRDLQKRAGEWSRAYKTKKERSRSFMFAHTHEEVSEAWKAWREGEKQTYFVEVIKHGAILSKPEGLGPELADAAIMLALVAEEEDIDLDEEIRLKMIYLNDRLEAKQARKRRKHG